MQHWLTVHHPREIGAESDHARSGVWVRKEQAHRFADLAEGDEVLIYETLSGPSRWLEVPDGARRRSEYEPGRGGVVAVGRVIEVLDHLPVTRARQDNGDSIDWARLAVLSVEPLPRTVSRLQVNSALGLQPRAAMRGFGGFRRVTPSQFHAIVEAGGG